MILQEFESQPVLDKIIEGPTSGLLYCIDLLHLLGGFLGRHQMLRRDNHSIGLPRELTKIHHE
jgi:hypothetical protein